MSLYCVHVHVYVVWWNVNTYLLVQTPAKEAQQRKLNKSQLRLSPCIVYQWYHLLSKYVFMRV